MRPHRIPPALILFSLLGLAGSARAASTLGASPNGCSSLAAAQVCTLTTGGGTAPFTWSASPTVSGASLPQTTTTGTNTYTAPGVVAGRTTVSVTVMDATGATWAGAVTLVTASITISPTSASITTSQTQQFTATVSGATNTGVTWSINPQIGTIDQTGLYTAPPTVNGTTKVTVTATSQADATKSASATISISPTIDIGSGAPTPALAQQFISAFYRNGFSALAGLPPLGTVKSLGSTAGFYVQEFPDAANDAGVKYALASASATVAGTASDGSVVYVDQIYGPVYAYYLTIGATTAGYPLSDTNTCPSFDPANSCLFQLFDKSYALFVYSNPLGTTGATTFSVTAGIYTEWTALGGAGGIGRPISAPAAVTAALIPPATAGSAATAQTFSGGVIYSITSGSAKGQVHGVTEPIYDMYVADGGPSGSLGLPTSEVIVNVLTGLRKQTFEGGFLQYAPGGTVGTQLPVTAVSLTGATAGATINLNLGQTVTLTATPVDAQGDQLTGLSISWSSTNGQVISIQAQPNSQSAVLTAVGGGTAKVTAASGGITSASVNFVVISPCCQVGDGAPLSVQAAFQTALVRNRITVQTPVPSPATRVGSGYVQMIQSSGTPPVSYLIAQSDQSGSAYVVSGALLTAYQTLGGPAGTMGYPISDASAGGTQLFQNGALAGSPVQVVAGGILSKWALLGYEAGAAGVPVSDAVTFSTFGANSGVSQNFAGGSIFSCTAGPRAGSAYFVTGLILSTYNANGGAGGNLGMPLGDEFVTAGMHQQNFEGGSITYTAGAATAQIQLAPKAPAVTVAPTIISAGATARLAVSGFANGASIRISVTGQPPFTVIAANGAYTWQMFIPLATASGTLTVSAADAGGTASATGTLTIRGFDTNRVQMTPVGGNSQTGMPGALLPAPIQVALLDASGAPVVGAPVIFQASMGAGLSVSATVTDANGQAATYVRLPGTSGTVGVTAQSPMAQTAVTFYAVAAASSLANYPNVQQTGSAALGNGAATIARKGAMLAAVASILRYQQNRGAIASPNGLADAPTLNQFLTAYCGVDTSGNRVCDGFLSNPSSGEQIVNLWRAAQFTGGLDVAPLSPRLSAVADVVSQGEPVLLSLSLSLNHNVTGGHFVVATGVAADGSMVIQDPSALFARTNFNDYLNGFPATGGTWTGSLLGAVRFAVRSPSATRFLLGAISQPAALMGNLAFDVSSSAGACGLPLQMLDTVDSAGQPPAAGALVSKLQACDGLLPVYQVTVGASQPYRAFVTDLATGGSTFDVSGSAPTAYQASRPLLNLVLSPQTANIAAAGVVNAATFTSGIAPGEIVSIFGSGLASSAGSTTVDLDGTAATVLSASPFQVNAVVPPGIASGLHMLEVKSAYGTAQEQISVSAVAPAIFLIGSPPVGAVENQDGSLNGPTNPVARGQALVIFATGLGTVSAEGPLSVVNSVVTAVINGMELPVSFAGLAPGYIGLYQINVPIPTSIAPGLGINLTLKQGGQLSNAISVAIQ